MELATVILLVMCTPVRSIVLYAPVNLPLHSCNATVILVNTSRVTSIPLLYHEMHRHSNETQVMLLCPLQFRRVKQLAATNGLRMHHDSDRSSYPHCVNNGKFLSMILQFFQPTSVATIILNNECIDLVEDIKHKPGLFVRHFHVNEDSLIESVKEILYKIKTQDLTFIILLTIAEINSLIFDAAKSFDLTKFEAVWLTFSGESRILGQHIPWQVLSVVREKSFCCDKLDYHTRRAVVKKYCFARNQTSNMRTGELYYEPLYCNHDKLSVVARNPTLLLNWSPVFSWSGMKLSVLEDAHVALHMVASPKLVSKLKIGIILDKPFAFLSSSMECSNGIKCRTKAQAKDEFQKSCCIGMIIDLLLLLSQQLNFVADLYVVKDGYYGGKNGGKWNGLIQEIVLGHIDVAAATLIPTLGRESVVDFTAPFLNVDLAIMVYETDNQFDFINWNFMVPLSYELRVAIVATFFIGTILIYILENKHIVLKRITHKDITPEYRWRDGFLYFSGLTFQRDLGGKNPKQPGAKLTAVVFSFAMVVIMTTYTAVLTASKVSQTNTAPFLGFKDNKIVNPTNVFKYASVAYTSVESYFRKSLVFKRTHGSMKLFNSTEEAIHQLKIGNINAFIFTNHFLSYYRAIDHECKLRVYGPAIQQGGYSLGVRKNSPWKMLLSRSILKLRDCEDMERIYNKWFPDYCIAAAPPTESNLSYYGGLFVMIATCFVVSVGLLAAEHFCYRQQRRVISPIQDRIHVWRKSRDGRRNAIVMTKDIRNFKKTPRIIDSDNSSVIGEEESKELRALYVKKNNVNSKFDALKSDADREFTGWTGYVSHDVKIPTTIKLPTKDKSNQ